MTADEYRAEAVRIETELEKWRGLDISNEPYVQILLEAWRRRAQSYRELAKEGE